MKFFDRLVSPDFKKMAKNSDIESLIALLKSDDVDYRIHAAILLGDLRDHRAIDPLIQSFLDDKEVSSYAQNALIKIGDINPLLRLFSSIKELNSPFRRRLACIFGQIKDPQAIPLLVNMVAEANSDDKLAAIEALGSLEYIQMKDLLISQFRESNPELWGDIANLLKKNSWQPLDNKDWAKYYIGLGSWEQCEKFGSDSIDALLAYLDRYPCNKNAIKTMGVVGRTHKDSRIGIKLSECLKNCSSSQRGLALFALCDIADRGTVDQIGQHLLSISVEIERFISIRALEAIGDEKSIYYLKEALLKYKDPLYQKEILKVLNKLQNNGKTEINLSQDPIILKAQKELTDSQIFDPNVRCSLCNKELEVLGDPRSWHGAETSVVGFSTNSLVQMEQWRGNVCTKCQSIFCPTCIKVGFPTPCPKCGEPTHPAQRVYLEKILKKF